MHNDKLVIGVDFGTDSCRAAVFSAEDGTFVAESSCNYPRWAERKFCNPAAEIYRQHPLDYIESFENVIRGIVSQLGADSAAVKGIGIDTTASTPVLVDGEGTPLSLKDGFQDDPDAMFVLWKDHSAKAEADRINALSKGHETDYTSFSGGSYSAEWAWSKVLHILGKNGKVAEAAVSWMEHCDWMTGYLVGNTSPDTAPRSRCAAGHKAMWRAEWGGLPPERFLAELDPRLAAMRSHYDQDTKTADFCCGCLRKELAEKFGLPSDVKVALGSIDAHVGAVGASISPNVLTRIMGTSTCDILVSDRNSVGDKRINGICGQVDGSVVPGLVGFEAGQSAFGDVYAWFKDLLMWPVIKFSPELKEEYSSKILGALNEEAKALSSDQADVLALDWFNGRRTPDLDNSVKASVSGLNLGTTAPMIYKALVEATAFGSRAIAERFRSEGIEIKSVLAIGGISQKSPFVMQTLSDVTGMPISVVDCSQACALGAAMFASVAAGIHASVPDAQVAMRSPLGRKYFPDEKKHAEYERKYENYLKLGSFVENLKNKSNE